MTAAGQALVRRHQLTQIRNGGLAAALVMQLGEDLLKGKINRDEFIAGVIAQGRLSHTAAVRLAKQFLTEYHQLEAPHLEHREPPMLAADDGQTLGRAVGTLRDLDTLDRKARGYGDEFMKIVGGLAVRQHQTTLDAGRDVIVLSAAANDRRWRRITDGKPCAFCAMLATRTDYTSPFAAQYVVGRGKTTKPGARGRRGLGVRPRGSRSLGEKYHDNCGCTVAEVFDDWEPSYAERQQKALYKEARKACKKKGLEPTTKNILAQMRELGDGTVHDAHVPEGQRRKPGRKPKTQTGGSGGGRKKPPRRGAGHGDRREPTPPNEDGDYQRPQDYRGEDNDPKFDALLAEKVIDGTVGNSGKPVGGHGYGKTPVGKRNTEFDGSWSRDEIAAAFYEALENGQRDIQGGTVTIRYPYRGDLLLLRFNVHARHPEDTVEFYPEDGSRTLDVSWKKGKRIERRGGA